MLQPKNKKLKVPKVSDYMKDQLSTAVNYGKTSFKKTDNYQDYKEPEKSVDEYDQQLENSLYTGRGIEAGKFAVNLARLARNEATKPPAPIIPGRTPLINNKRILPDDSLLDSGFATGVAELRARGLGSGYLNSLIANLLKEKTGFADRINAGNTTNEMNVQKVNADIVTANNAGQYGAARADQQLNLQLGAQKGAMQQQLMSSLFDNATNYYNYGVEKSNKQLARTQYDQYMTAITNPYKP